MSAVLLQQYHRKKRMPPKVSEPDPVPTEVEKPASVITESMSWRGFVLLTDSNGLLRLPVLETYESGGVIYQSSGAGGRMLPIYSLMANRSVLQQYYPWLGGILNRLVQDDLADESEMASVQSKVMSKGGFGFWIKKGRRCYFYGSNVMLGLVRNSFLTSDYAGIDDVFLTNASGLPVKQIPLSEFTQRDDVSIKTLVDSGTEASPFEVALLLRDDPDLNGVNASRLHSYIDWNTVTDTFEKLSGEAKIGFAAVIVDALQYVIDQGVKVDVARYPDAISVHLKPASKLGEASFSRLLGLTRVNGGYRYGGMRRVDGRWVIDPAINGRLDNSRFIVVSMPNWRLGADGFPIMSYVCRSQPDRNTTGLRHVGFIRVTNQGGLLRRLAGKFLPQIRAAEPDVQVWCSCQDFKYRFHWVLSQMGAAETPSGSGGQATNAPPSKTNPSFRPSLCKHLSACDQFIDFGNSDFRKLLRKVGTSPVQTTQPRREPVLRRNIQVSATGVAPTGTEGENASVTPPEAASAAPRLA